MVGDGDDNLTKAMNPSHGTCIMDQQDFLFMGKCDTFSNAILILPHVHRTGIKN